MRYPTLDAAHSLCILPPTLQSPQHLFPQQQRALALASWLYLRLFGLTNVVRPLLRYKVGSVPQTQNGNLGIVGQPECGRARLASEVKGLRREVMQHHVVHVTALSSPPSVTIMDVPVQILTLPR